MMSNTATLVSRVEKGLFFFCGLLLLRQPSCDFCLGIPAERLMYENFVKDYPLVLSSDVLSKEVPYVGDDGELKFYVEGLRFPDKDFDGLVYINLSLLEPIAEVRT